MPSTFTCFRTQIIIKCIYWNLLSTDINFITQSIPIIILYVLLILLNLVSMVTDLLYNLQCATQMARHLIIDRFS